MQTTKLNWAIPAPHASGYARRITSGVLLLIFCGLLLRTTKAALMPTNIWPQPKEFSSGSTELTVEPSHDFFQFVDNRGHESEAEVPATLQSAFSRYVALCFPDFARGSFDVSALVSADGSVSRVEDIVQGDPYSSQLLSSRKIRKEEKRSNRLTSLRVSVKDLDESHPQLDMNEAYDLIVDEEGGASLLAESIWGAMRGLETFSQLIQFDFDTESYVLQDAPW